MRRLAGLGLGLGLGACAPDPVSPPTAADSAGPDDTAPHAPDSGPDSGAPDAPADPGPLPLCINEFMPANDAALVTEAGETPDWIELHNPGEDDVDAAGWTLSDDPDEPDKGRLAIGTTVPAGGFLVLFADDGDGADHLPFRLSADGGAVGLYHPDGRGQLVRYGSVEDDFSIARTPDCCTDEGCLGFDFRGTPGAPNRPVVWEEQTVVSAGSTWRFWDAGTAPGTAWFLPIFDDSAWASGPAPLGFGDPHIATAVNGGPDGARHPTTWFRLFFALDDPASVRDASVDLMLDDGAVVFLNGQEAVRSNLPDGEVAPETLALGSIGPPNETTFFRYPLDPSLLQEGDNLLAIEVHQAAPTSSDLTLDVRLVVTVPQPTE